MNFVDFPVGPFLFSTGGIVLLCGIIFSLWILTRMVHEKGLSLQFLSHHLLIFILVAFVVGRLGATMKIWPYFASEIATLSFFGKIGLFLEKFFVFWEGEINTFWTGFTVLVTFFTLATLKKQNLWKWLDSFALPTVLLLIFWNFGAFLSAWEYGKPVSDAFWLGVKYDVQHVRYSVSIHPVQLYAMVYYGSVFYWGFRQWRQEKQQKDGTFFAIILLLVFLGNGILEFFRGDPSSMIEFGNTEMRSTQVVSFAMALITGFFLIFYAHPDILQQQKRRRKKIA